MRLVGITWFGLGLVAVGLVGCGGMAGELVDAGRLDGGAAPPPHDAGAPGGDAGSTAFDAGANEAADAGGGSATDAGGTGVDSGVPPRDAGTPPPDAGQTPADAGTPSRDAGGPPPDAGTAPHIDSFTGAPDNVKAGSPATLQWVLGGDAPTSLTVNATNVLNNAGNSHHVSPTAPSTTYQLTATNAAGTSTATVTIRVEAADSPYIDARKIPAAQTGFSTARVEPTAMPIDPDGGGVGAFRLGCTFSHMNFDDPLLFAKQPGAAVLNTYFGNVGVNAWSTDHSVQKSGNSTCAGAH